MICIFGNIILHRRNDFRLFATTKQPTAEIRLIGFESRLCIRRKIFVHIFSLPQCLLKNRTMSSRQSGVLQTLSARYFLACENHPTFWYVTVIGGDLRNFFVHKSFCSSVVEQWISICLRFDSCQKLSFDIYVKRTSLASAGMSQRHILNKEKLKETRWHIASSQ